MPGFNIRDFKANINGAGILPTNRFLVTIPLPRVLQSAQSLRAGESVAFTDISRLFSFRAESFKAPGINLDTTETHRYGIGPKQKMPYNASFTDTAITFLSDRNGEIWNLFYNWTNSIFNYGGVESSGGGFRNASYKARYLTDYAVDIGVTLCDYEGNFSNEIIMHNAYPININDVPLSWSDNNNLLKITVGFTFRDWSIVDSGIANPGGRTQIPSVSPQPSTEFGTTPVPSNPAASSPQKPLVSIGQNEVNENTGRFNGILGTGADTPTFLPGS